MLPERPRSASRRPGRSRLSRSGEFDRVFRHGRSQANRYLILYTFPRSDDGVTRGDAGHGHSDPAPNGQQPPDPTNDQEVLSKGTNGTSQIGTGGCARLGLSVSRKVGGAVERNRVKRVLREAFAAEAGELRQDHDYVLVARPDLRALAEREGLGGARAALVELIERAGVRTGQPGGQQ